MWRFLVFNLAVFHAHFTPAPVHLLPAVEVLPNTLTLNIKYLTLCSPPFHLYFTYLLFPFKY